MTVTISGDKSDRYFASHIHHNFGLKQISFDMVRIKDIFILSGAFYDPYLFLVANMDFYNGLIKECVACRCCLKIR